MASFISTNETLTAARAGSISRNYAEVVTRTLNQAAGVAEGLLVSPSGTNGYECVSPTTEALVKSAIGFTVFRPMSEDFDSTHHYADNEQVSIMREGHMTVLCEGTCVADAPVFARILTDGGSNTVVGKVRANSDYPSGGVVITPASAVNSTYYTMTLNDGGAVNETFTYLSDGSATVAEIAAGLVAIINATSTRFAATGTVTISVTAPTSIVEVIELTPSLSVTTPARAMRVRNCFFDASRTGAGLVEIRLNSVN